MYTPQATRLSWRQFSSVSLSASWASLWSPSRPPPWRRTWRRTPPPRARCAGRPCSRPRRQPWTRGSPGWWCCPPHWSRTCTWTTSIKLTSPPDDPVTNSPLFYPRGLCKSISLNIRRLWVIFSWKLQKPRSQFLPHEIIECSPKLRKVADQVKHLKYEVLITVS